MTRRDHFNIIAAVVLLATITTCPAFAEKAQAPPPEEAVTVALEPQEDTESEEAVEVEVEEAPAETAKIETHTSMGAYGGYRFFDVDSYGGRAAQYEYLHSSPTFGAFYNTLGKDLKLGVDGDYLNNKDYYGDLLFDYSGYYRLHMRTESLFHNLGHEQLFAPSFTMRGPLGQTDYIPNDLDPASRHGLRVERDLADFRFKFHDFPAHLNLGYWRMHKEGNSQLIYADQAFEGTPNTIYSKPSPVNGTTKEGTVGVDAHLGPVDLIYTFLIRRFDDNVGIPKDFFVGRTDIAGVPVRNAGVQQHNEEPESRFWSNTVKLHTSLSGGIVGAASYSYGKRENRSQLSDIQGADQTSSILQNVAGDITYIPCKEFTFAMKYRRQEVDNQNPSTVTSVFATNPTVDVRPSIGTEKDVVTATFSIRPTNLFTIKGEYKGEFLHRDNLTNGGGELSWRSLPENVGTNRGTISILSRPLKGLRLKALYGYTATDHPSYGTSFETKQEGEILATYNRLNSWGATASYHIARENNASVTRFIITSLTPTVVYSPYPSPLPRFRATDQATGSFWITPIEKLTITASYGFLRSSTDQTILFTVVSPGVQDTSNYTGQAQIYSVSGMYKLNDALDLSLALQQVRSYAQFTPTFINVGSSDTSGIAEISRTKTVESSLSARADYRISKNFSCTFDYTYRDYDEKYSSLFDGTVQTFMLSVNSKW